jgi:hypothetical protein
MKSNISASELFPVAFGHEHETSQMIGPVPLPMTSSTVFANKIGTFTGKNGNPLVKGFLVNGFKLYQGGADIAEVATPECSTPEELVSYIYAGRLIFRGAFEEHLKEISDNEVNPTVFGRIQDRVVAFNGARRGSHYNFGIASDQNPQIDVGTVLNHQATRSFVTGAGYISSRGPKFAQKVGGIVEVEGYNYLGFMYRSTVEEGTFRFEDRCADINISEWATWMHIGSMSLAIAVSRVKELREMLTLDHIDGSVIPTAKRLNAIRLNSDGEPVVDGRSFTSVDYQQRLAEIVMDKLIFYTDELPENYFRVAKELYEYCDDFRGFLNGSSQIEHLANRADWAAKFELIIKGIKRDQKFGIKRHINDYKARAADLLFDSTRYVAKNGEITENRQSVGEKLAKRNKFVRKTTDNNILRATKHAPPNTRASLRQYLLNNYEIADVDWHSVTVSDESREELIEILNVTQTDFSDEQKARLSEVKRKQL